jgi:hypothetical protein
MRFSIVAAVVALQIVAAPRAQESLGDAARRKTYDTILDLNVRDGFVYYRALRADRAKLDGYINLLASASLDRLSREDRIAFWLNAYNALVLKTVVDHYPIPRRTTEYPEHSIRQIPGAFERTQYRLAGRMLTLDQIEQTVLAEFKDPRLYLALGRGAVGSGRLRSEAYSGAELEKQLTEVAQECNSRPECVHIDRDNNTVNLSSIFSWREKEFVAAFADKAPAAFASRSPIERAVLAFIQPKLLTIEKDFLAKNEFRVVYTPFDWKLNDLTGRGGR